MSLRGIPQKFYVDYGACYRSEQLDRILTSLGIGLRHSRPYKPQGRGKPQRRFKNIRDSFLPALPVHSPSMTTLSDRLDQFEGDYSNSKNSGIKHTPYERYRQYLSYTMPAPERLMDDVRRRDFRRVKKDRAVQIQGRVFDVPAKLIDKTVDLLFHDDAASEVEVLYQGITCGRAVPLNLVANARGGRDYGTVAPKAEVPIAPPRPTQEVSGGMLFDRKVYPQSEGTL